MESPAQRMFARHRLGLPDVCLNELALRHMAQPAADHFPVARRYPEHALHHEGIEIEDDCAADPNQCGPENDVGCVHHTVWLASAPPAFSKGDKPDNLLVQQLTKVEFYINLKSAKALGITVPPPISGRADEVIE
jgi:hypothetical protein